MLRLYRDWDRAREYVALYLINILGFGGSMPEVMVRFWTVICIFLVEKNVDESEKNSTSTIYEREGRNEEAGKANHGGEVKK